VEAAKHSDESVGARHACPPQHRKNIFSPARPHQQSLPAEDGEGNQTQVLRATRSDEIYRSELMSEPLSNSETAATDFLKSISDCLAIVIAASTHADN
jgi:hypothetical protein